MENKNDYGRISLGRIIPLGNSQDFISFNCFIGTWVIQLFASLLWIDGLLWLELSYCTSFIVFENVIATTAVLTLMPEFLFYSYSSVAWVLTALLCYLAMW